MLIIKTYLYQIAIPDNEAYAIFSNDYFIDEEGNVTTDLSRLDVYEYGDIIIQTSSIRFTIRKVYAAYGIVADILDYIEKHRDDKVILVNLNELRENWNGSHFGKLEVKHT